MSLLATVTCDLYAVDRPTWRKALGELARLGLASSIDGADGLVALPRGVLAGDFPGSGPDQARALQERLSEAVSQCLHRLDIRGSILVTVAERWSWQLRALPRSEASLRIPRARQGHSGLRPASGAA